MSNLLACLSAALAMLLLACTAHAQRLDLDAPTAPELPDGGILTHLAERLNTEAEEFRIEYRALRDDAPPIESLAMRTRIALTEMLAGWLINAPSDENPIDTPAAATRHAAALALAAHLPRFDEVCRTLVRADDPSRHAAQHLALQSLLCLSDPDCRPMLRATARDDRPDDPLIRAVAEALHDLFTDDQPSPPITLPNPIAEIAQRHHWSDNITDAWSRTTAAWSAQAARDPAFRAWIEHHLAALSLVLESISADTTQRDTATLDAARELFATLLSDEAPSQRTIARVLHDADLTARTLRAIEALAAAPPDQRTASPDRQAIRAARHAAHRRWLDSELPPGHIRVIVALERLADARTEANRERPRSTEPPGPIATERRLRTALAGIEAELLQSLPALITDRARLAHPETVSLLARHQATTTTLINYLELPARRAELGIEQATGIDPQLIGRVNQRLARWQRETSASDPAAVDRAHQGINAHARLHAALRALPPSAPADLARAIDRPGLARADWREAIANQRRAAFNALADATGTEADLAIANEIAERLEIFARLAVLAGTDRTNLARPLHRHFAPTIETALTQLRDNAFGRSLEPMATARRAAQALHNLQQLLEADPTAAAALAFMLEQPDTAPSLPALQSAGRPWTPTAQTRATAAHAARWLGELHHAAQTNTPDAQRQPIADHAIEQLQRAAEARERAQ